MDLKCVQVLNELSDGTEGVQVFGVGFVSVEMFSVQLMVLGFISDCFSISQY